jgi:uncharacterized protein (DUF488 family)
MAEKPGEFWTIGHYTYPQSEFLNLLDNQKIDLLIDVRSFPGSRRSPQFNRENMQVWIPKGGIRYQNMLSLGGRRKAQHVADENANAGWVNPSFKNYADYTSEKPWQDGADELGRLANQGRVCIMCSEPMPWRCHRSVISTIFVEHGWTVHHIMGLKTLDHVLGKWGPMPKLDKATGIVTFPKPPESDAAPADKVPAKSAPIEEQL